MNAWDTVQRVWIVQRYHALQSVISIQIKFRRDFGGTSPSRWAIMRVVNMFAESGSTARRPYHRDPYVQETIAAVANPRVSTRNLSAQLGVSRRSLQRIIYDDLNLFLYKVQITSRLNPI